MKEDEPLLRKMREHDLLLSNVCYHLTCKNKYVANINRLKVHNETKSYRQCLEEAHSIAFEKVCTRVENEIIQQSDILKSTDLLQTYTKILEETDFANPLYRGENLKCKLEAKYPEQLRFCKLDSVGKFESQLIYSSRLSTDEAVKMAFLMGSTDVISECARTLRSSVQKSFKEIDLKWPFTADSLEKADTLIPSDLQNFLRNIFSGKTSGVTPQTNRLVSSIGQDICRAVTNGEWKLPKHIQLSMTLRHLYRSKQLTALLNRLGHSENHTFSVELETAIANALDETSSMLSTQIVRNPTVPFLFHSEFDNFDQLINTLRGIDSVHTAHGIMMQELCVSDTDGHGGNVPIVPSSQRSGEHTLRVQIHDELPQCYVAQKASPGVKGYQRINPEQIGSIKKANDKTILWVLLRNEKSPNGQEVAGWTGFISETGLKPKRLTTIDYYPVINKPITEYRTVQECLRYAEEATKEVGQTYTVTTFDLGVCMKALPLIWNDPEKYKNHIVMVGTFHLICAYLRMVGKKMCGSGLSDIMIEAGLIGTGSILGVFSGKHYERSLHCHKVIVESLERLLIEQFMVENDKHELFSELPESSSTLIQSLIRSPSKQLIDETVTDTNVMSIIKSYTDYKQSIRDGYLGKTAIFWLSYMDHIWLVFCLLRAVKSNDFALYAETLSSMSDIFFSFDGQNYARYLTYFATFLANIEDTHPGASTLLKRGAMSVARSFTPGNRCAVDKTMEETFMKHAKSHSGAGSCGAGISGISGNFNAYQRWVRTTHERSKFVEATFTMADMLYESDGERKHRETRHSEIEKSEKEVCETVDAIHGFFNPFTIEDKKSLYCISSGSVVPKANEEDILCAEEKGKLAKTAFITERLQTQTRFFEPIKRQSLKTMEDMGKGVQLKTGTNKVVQYKQQGNIAIQLLVQSQQPEFKISLNELLKYPLTPVPFSIGTADGCLAKNEKSKGMKYLLEGQEPAKLPEYDKTCLLIEDGNALFHSMREVPGNFKMIAEKLFVMTPKNVDIVFSTDMYKTDSAKSMERARRGNSDKLLIQGENTKRPADWKMFLSNADNKTQLSKVICKVWGNDTYAPKLKDRQVIFICEGEAYKYTSDDGNKTKTTRVEYLDSTQEETDTRVVLYCLYAKSQGYKTVQVRTPDSDIFFILLHYIEQLGGMKVLFDTGSGNKRKLIDMTKVSKQYSQEYRSALLGLHAFCGCDSTSAFKGRGHTIPIKTLEKKPMFTTWLAQLGESWQVTNELENKIDEFTCAIYGHSMLTSVDNVRVLKIQEKCQDKPLNAMRNIDMGMFPPCKRSLIQHIKRVNYQVAIWKRSHEPRPCIPNILDNQGWKNSDGIIEPMWVDGELIPNNLIDTIETLSDGDDEEDIA